MAEKRTKNGVKRTRSKEGKLQGNSFPELKRGLTIASTMLQPDLKIEGEKWEAGHLLEALVADALTLPLDEQRRRALRGQAVVEAIRLRAAPGDPLSVDDAPSSPAGNPGPGLRALPPKSWPSKRRKPDGDHATAKVNGLPKGRGRRRVPSANGL